MRIRITDNDQKFGEIVVQSLTNAFTPIVIRTDEAPENRLVEINLREGDTVVIIPTAKVR